MTREQPIDPIDAELATMHDEHVRTWGMHGHVFGDVVVKIADLHGNGDQFCPECQVLAPCPTYRIIEASIGVADQFPDDDTPSG